MPENDTTACEGKSPLYDCSASYGIWDGTPASISHVERLGVTEVKICKRTGSHILRDHVNKCKITEGLTAANITERRRKAKPGKHGNVERQYRYHLPILHRKTTTGDDAAWDED